MFLLAEGRNQSLEQYKGDESGLYYLQSRYYNPTWGRFINADDIDCLGVGNNLTSYNLFAYCGNNPVCGYDPTGHWDWGWKEQAALGTTIFIVGMALLLAVPTGGSSLAIGTLALSATTVSVAGTTMAFAGVAITGDAVTHATVNYAKQSKKSDKERSTQHPSWVSQSDVDLNKTAQQNATELLNNKFGEGNWRKGAGSDFNQIVKWINRSFRIFSWMLLDMWEE